MSDTIDLIGEIHPWLSRYDALSGRHTESLDAYRDAAGDVREGEHGRYDEQRFDNTIEADDFLGSLVAHLRELVGPPVPGTSFTLTFAGPERHYSHRPYSFVVNAADLDSARRTLLLLPSFENWLYEQIPWESDAREELDVLFVADQSHPGIPEWGTYNDLRREQAALLNVEPARDSNVPALPPAPRPGWPPLGAPALAPTTPPGSTGRLPGGRVS